MDARRFNAKLGYLNEKWCADFFGLTVNPQNDGPDLFDRSSLDNSNLFAEVKFRLVRPDKPTLPSFHWTAQKQQVRYWERHKPIFWMLGTYELSRIVSGIRSDIHSERLENFITDRELLVVRYDWAKQFPIKRGKYYQYAYLYKNRPGFTPIPRITKTLKADGGLVHFTEGVDQDYFKAR